MKLGRALAFITLVFASLFFATPAHANCVSPQQSVQQAVTDASSESVVTTVETCGGDDVSYQIPLSVGVTFDGQTYDRVYATTNSVITFGAPDGTYWDYPRTASISLYSMDWLILPEQKPDEHLIIQSSQGGFSVDISARPYGNYNVPLATNIVITAAINYDGSVAISYMVAGPTYDSQTRTGVRLTSGAVVSLEEYGIVQVAEPVVLTPVPVVPTPEPTAEPTPSPTPSPTQIPTSEPVSEPMPEIVPPVLPVGPIPVPEPSDTPVLIPEPPTPVLVPVELPPFEVPEIPVVIVPELPAIAETPEQLAEAAKADDPQVSEELASIPLLGNVAVAVLEVFNALGNVGADMTPEVREESQKTIVASVLVSNVAISSITSSSSVSSFRRKE